MERHQQSEQFEVLDPAQIPAKPVKPRIIIFLVAGLFIGLAVGGAITFLLEYQINAFYGRDDVESYLNIPVLASIPAVTSHKQQIRSH